MNKMFTKLLLLVIAISGWMSMDAQVYFLNENFAGTTGSTPPSGWTNNTLSGNVSFDTWRFNNPGGRALNSPISSPAAIFDSDNYSAGGGFEDVTLESPSFATTGYAGVTLKWDQYFQSGFGGVAMVQVWDGSTWTTVYNNSTTTTTNPNTQTINITNIAANKSDVKVRFRWQGDWSWYWIVDNIQVYYVVDVQPLSVDAPSRPCGAVQDSVKVTVRNNSAFTVNNVPVTVDISGIGSATQNGTITSIPALSTAQIAFAGINTTAGGTLNVKAYTTLAGDNNAGNDTNNYSLNIVGTPTSPNVTGGSRCGAGSVTLSGTTALSTDSVVWYTTNPPTAPPVSKNKVFNTPTLSGTTTYFAAASRGNLKPLQLTTTTAGGNGQQGAMFDIIPSKPLILDSISFYEFTPSAGTYTMRIYYKLGTYSGFNTNAGAWTNHGDYIVTSSGSAGPLKFDINDLQLDNGVTYGFYITIITGPQTTLTYTTLGGPATYSNADLKVNAGIGVPGLFGGIFNPRGWNGILHYREVPCESNLVPVVATINDVAKGTTLAAKPGSKGTFNAGTTISPDVNASPDSIKYDLVTPTGFSNSNYGPSGNWNISSIVVETPNGYTVPSNMYSFINPSSLRDGEFRLHTDTTLNDSIVCVTVNVRRLDNNCDTSITRCIYVAPRPIARFNHTEVCEGDVTELINTSYLQAGVMTYDWDFGDSTSSDLANPAHVYAKAGTYNVKLNVVSDKGYTSSASASVLVKEIPAPNFDFANACEGTAVSMVDASTLPPGTATYSWNYGDNSTGTGSTTSHLYAQPGIYPVAYTVDVNGCAATITKYVTQAPRSTPDFTNTALQCDNKNVAFTNATTPPSFGTTGYEWKLGDGAVVNSFNVAHTYNTFNTFDVTLIGRTDLGCVDSVTKTITLKESPVVNYNITGSLCHGETLTFNNSSTTPVGQAPGSNTYEWNFGDANTSTSESPTHQYAGPGTKTITMTARSTNGCDAVNTQTVTVNLKPNADFVANDVCLGSETKFTNNSSIADASALTYDWNLDGSTSANTNPAVTYTSAGTKTITLTTSSANGCNSVVTKTVEVNPLPAADIIIASQLSFDGAFSFTTNSVGVRYKWLFGDGGSDSAKTVTYKYPVDGVYTVYLLVETDKGCLGTNSQKLGVNRLGVDESNLSNSVKMYPNPGNGVFAIEFAGINSTDVKTMTVLNSLGQKVADLDVNAINNNLLNINIADQAAGIYFIQVETSTGKASFKYNLTK